MAISLKEKLVNLGAERLAVLLSDHASQDKILSKKLKLALTALAPEKLAKTLRSQINQLKKSNRFIEWQEIKKFTKELVLIRDSIENDLLPQSPSLASTLAEEFLMAASKILERLDDSYGNISHIFSETSKIWGKAYVELDYEPDPLATKLLHLTLKDSYGIYGSLIEGFIPALKRKGLENLENKVIISLSSTKQLYDKKRLTDILLLIADAKNSVDDYIKTFEVTGLPVRDKDRLSIAKRLNNAWRNSEALDWLESIENKTHYFCEYMDLKIESYELDGNTSESQTLRWEAFKSTLNMSYYLDYLKATKAENYAAIQQEALLIVYSFKNIIRALHWLVDAGFTAEAAKYLREHIKEIDGSYYTILRPIAKHFSESGYPLEAVLLYRNLCEPILTSANSRYYPYAAKDLKKAVELSLQVTEWDTFTTGDDYLEFLKKQHFRKYGFWQTYEALIN